MKKTQLKMEYFAPESNCIEMHLDSAILSGSFTHEDIGDETDISGKFGFVSKFRHICSSSCFFKTLVLCAVRCCVLYEKNSNQY